MQRVRSALRLGCPVRFKDRWQGQLNAFEVDDEWQVANVVLSRGVLVFRRSVKLAFSTASHWDDDSLSLDCASEEAFGRQVAAAAVPPNPLSADTPTSAAGARLAGALVELASRRVSHFLLAGGALLSELRMAPVESIALEGGIIRLAAPLADFPMYLPDSELEKIVWDALARHPYLTGDDRRAVDVEVVDGVVYLLGNVRTPQARGYAYEAAGAVRGALDVRNNIVADQQLEVDVARALDVAGLCRHGRIYIRSSLGDVAVGGYVNAPGVLRDIEKLVSGVRGVRSVTMRVDVAGEAPPEPSPAPPSMPIEPAPESAA